MYNKLLDVHEICVGNWVQHNLDDPRHPGQKASRPVRISAIFQNDRDQTLILYVHPWVPPAGIIAPLETFHPLPISKEILQLNGATCIEVGDNGAATPAQYRKRFEKWEVVKHRLWYDRLIDRWSLGGCEACQLAYVHELQNAARLVGLLWEIDAQKMYD